MKKLICLVLSISLLTAVGIIPASAYTQPFNRPTLGTKEFRIPSMITLNDGSVFVSADLRNTNGSDSPQNLDTVVAKQTESGWNYQIVNHFGDVAFGTSSTNSASFIDPAMIQSKQTGRIFVITDAFPTGYGYPNCKKGTGYVEIDGKERLALTNVKGSEKIGDYKFYVGEFKDGFAKIVGTDNYTVDEEYNIYKDGAPVYSPVINDEQNKVQQNVFFFGSDFHIFPTCYLAMRYSDDNGETWSPIQILSPQFKDKNESFLGIGPGRGALVKIGDKERILFAVYDNSGIAERTSVIYSDDNGITWKRSNRVDCNLVVNSTSEAQIVNCPDGSLMMFVRNKSGNLAYSKSYNNGETWTRAKADLNVRCQSKCMMTFINHSQKIDGKSVVIGAFGSSPHERKNGIIVVGTFDGEKVNWISKYKINEGFYAYSCLTELENGKIALLYEDEPSHISYAEFSLDEKGNIIDASGEVQEFTFWENLRDKLISFFAKLFSFFA